jgi:hypothetical protein
MRPTAWRTTRPSSSPAGGAACRPCVERCGAEYESRPRRPVDRNPACATDPRRRRTPHTAALRRDLATVDRASGTKPARAPRGPCPATEPRFSHRTQRRWSRRPAARREPLPTRVQDRRNARSLRTPPTRDAGRRTATAHEDPAAGCHRPNQQNSSREEFRGCLTDRRSAAAGRAPPYHRSAADGASRPAPGGGRQPTPHAPDAGGQLQRLVRQPSALRDETNRSAHQPALELAGRRRGVPPVREAMRSRVREPAT